MLNIFQNKICTGLKQGIRKLWDIRRFIDIFSIAVAGIFTYSALNISMGVGEIAALLILTSIQLLFLFPVMLKERYWRIVSAYEAVGFLKQSLMSSVCIFILAKAAHVHWLSLNWIAVNALTTLCLLCGTRLSRRMVFEWLSQGSLKKVGTNTLIYGTGSAGASLASRFISDPALGVNLVGFVESESKPSKFGKRLRGIKVLGTLDHLPILMSTHKIQQIIFTDPVKDGQKLRDILQVAHSLKIQTKVVTDLGLKLQKSEGESVLREINLQDLLQRPKVEVDLASTKTLLSGKTVLISGAGGSIGSELVRQIASMNPSTILALDHSEFNLYEIESEMRKIGGPVEFIPILSDLKEPELLSRVFEQHQPYCVFHAAAYKHVHLVENNPEAAILNNLVSLKHLLECSILSSVECFVLISSDKAVNPKGIMGCTKRAGELMVSEAAAKSGRRFCSVRFGNVLGSSGSLIPQLKKQILNGGPVTVTHPDMERYFMLIPEAVSLVLKAASISEPGDINVLKMGGSVKILDIVKSLIVLCGKDEDSIPLIITGVRPGEKLKEELYLTGDELSTQHPDIVVLPRGAQGVQQWSHSRSRIKFRIDEIIALAKKGDSDASRLLKDLVEHGVESEDSGNANQGTDPKRKPHLVA